jgi:hypothetical protein
MAGHIERRKFLAALGGAAAWPLAAQAQQPAKRSGIWPCLNWNPANFRPFRTQMRELGYIDGQWSLSIGGLRRGRQNRHFGCG